MWNRVTQTLCINCGATLDSFGICPRASVGLIKISKSPVHCGTRVSFATITTITVTGSHFDYTNQAWTVDGVYVRCGHPESMDCRCYGKAHAGQPAPIENLPTATETE